MKGGAAMAGALGLGALFAACGGRDSGGEATTAAGGGGETAAATSRAGHDRRGGGAAFTGTLRVTGLGVDLIDPIKETAEKALGFKLAFDVTDSVTMVQKAITQPGSFDVFSGYSYQYDQAWPSGNFHNEEIAKIAFWGQLSPLINHGNVDPTAGRGAGLHLRRRRRTVPRAVRGSGPERHVGDDREHAERARRDHRPVDRRSRPARPWATSRLYTIGAAGTIFNMDSMGYNADVIQKEPNEVSWAELFNPEYKGRVALLNDPGIGLQDAGAGSEGARPYDSSATSAT